MPGRQGNHIENDEGQEERAAFLLLAGQATEDQAVGDAHELHQQQARISSVEPKPSSAP